MRPLSALEKVALIEYNFVVVDSLFGFLQSTSPPGKSDPEFWASRQELRGAYLEKNESSPRPAARDGMEQEPYEFRIRPSESEIKG
jgi:hypothetical protein